MTLRRPLWRARRGPVVRILMLAIVAACAGASVWTGAAPATAETAPVAGGSWFWREQMSSIDAGPTNAALPPLSAAEVPAGDFPVAVKGDDPSGQGVGDDKETFIHIDTSSIEAGSTVTKFVLTFTEEAASVNASSAKIGAFPVTEFFTDGAAAAAWSDRPGFDNTGAAIAGTRTSGGGVTTWTFDLTALVAKWVSGDAPNNGLAFVPIEVDTTTPPWEVIWKGSSPAPTTTGSFFPPAPSDNSGETTDTSTVDTTQSSSFSVPVAITPDVSAPLIAPVEVPSPAPPAAPRRALRIRPAASHPGITLGFVLACIVLAVMVLGAMISLGELGEPQPPRRGSVLRALERRVGTAAAP